MENIAECSKIIANVESQTKLVSDRVEKSSNATLLSAELSKLEQVRDKANAMARYLKLIRESNPDPEAFIHTMSEQMKYDAECSEEHNTLALHMSCMHALMFSDFDSRAYFFKGSSPEARC